MERQPPIRFTQLIVRYRFAFFALAALSFGLSFNGQWMIGRDTAAYRALGHRLATTGKYSFRDRVSNLPGFYDQQDTRYPGLPILLAAIEKVTGSTSPTPPILVMCALALVALGLSYRLMRLYFPHWLAISVVVGMGTNQRFLQYANELLTDMPFLVALLAAMLAYECWLREPRRGRAILAGSVMFLALLVAAVMRPTFWMFALALLVACAWGLITRRSSLLRKPAAEQNLPPDVPVRPVIRLRFLGPIVAMGLAAMLFVLVLDLRPSHGSMGGGYGDKIARSLGDLHLRQNTHELLENALPYAFFSARGGPGFIQIRGPVDTVLAGERQHDQALRLGAGSLLSLVVIVSGILLARRNALWGIFFAVTIVTVLLLGPVPRYFLMLLPLLFAAWNIAVERAARLFRTLWLREAIMLVGLGLTFVPNVIRSFNSIAVQHGLTSPIGPHFKWIGLHYVGFLKTYDEGEWAGFYDLAKMVNANVSPKEKIIGPEPTVLTYLSDRQVYPTEMIAPRGGGVSTELSAALVPAPESGPIFSDYDRRLRGLERAPLIHLGKALSEPAGGYRLLSIDVLQRPPKHHGHHNSAHHVRIARRGAHKLASPPTTAPTTGEKP